MPTFENIWFLHAIANFDVLIYFFTSIIYIIAHLTQVLLTLGGFKGLKHRNL